MKYLIILSLGANILGAVLLSQRADNPEKLTRSVKAEAKEWTSLVEATNSPAPSSVKSPP